MPYSNSVLVGNWSEERLKKEYEFKMFLRKRDRRELLLQKSRILFSNLLMEKPMSLSGMYVQYGFNAQIVASEMIAKHTGGGLPQYGLALSSLVTDRQVDNIQNITDGCMMTLSPITTPCCRNTFVISAKDESVYGSKLMYGDEFYLKAENYGDPQTGERLLIRHCVVDLNLSVMNQNWMPTFFGPECGVNLRDFQNIHKRNTAENVFMMISDVETTKMKEN